MTGPDAATLGPWRRQAAWLEGAVLAALVAWVLVAGGETVRASYHGYLHATLGEAVLAEGLRPENPYHAGTPLRYYTLYPALGAALGRLGLGAVGAFALLNVCAALLFAPALDALGRACGLGFVARRYAFLAAVLGFNALGWIGWWLEPPAAPAGAVPVFAFESLTFAAHSWGWDARLQAFLPKFLNVSSFALALAPGLWALAHGLRLATRADEEPSPPGLWTWCALTGTAAAALAVNPLVGGFAGLGLVGLWLSRFKVAATREHLAWLVSGAAACLLALPFLLGAFVSAPEGPSLTGTVRFQHDGLTNLLGPGLLLLFAAGTGRRAWHPRAATGWVVAFLLCCLALLIGGLPWGNEYKFARLAGILLALPFGSWAARSRKTRAIAAGLLLAGLPTTVIVVQSYLVWGQTAPLPPLRADATGRLEVREDLRFAWLPEAVTEALATVPREAVVWTNFALPAQGEHRGVVQGHSLAPVLGHPLFVDAPQIHNDQYPDLPQRLAWTAGSSNLDRAFGPVRAGTIRQALAGPAPGLWEGGDPSASARALQAAREQLPERAFLVLDHFASSALAAAVEAAGGRLLATAGSVRLWWLEPRAAGAADTD